MIYTIISAIILTSYVLAVCTRWGVPKSVSQSFFDIRNKWIFSAVMVVSFGLLVVPLMEAMPEAWQWSGFLTVAGGVLIGFAPNLKDTLEEKVHMTGAALLGVGSQTVVGVLMPWMLIAWVAWIPFAFGEKRVFWAEMIGGLTLMVAIL